MTSFMVFGGRIDAYLGKMKAVRQLWEENLLAQPRADLDSWRACERTCDLTASPPSICRSAMTSSVNAEGKFNVLTCS